MRRVTDAKNKKNADEISSSEGEADAHAPESVASTEAGATAGSAEPVPTTPVNVPETGDREADDDGAQEEEQEQDLDSPEAIARRVAALGDDDEIEKLASSEERKLAERKAARRGGKKGGLEQAATKRLAKIGTKARPQREVATAIEAADPLVERSIRAEDWAKKNQKTVVGVVGGVLLLALAFGGVAYMDRQKAVAASVALAEAVADQGGRIGEPAKDDDDPEKAPPPGPSFKTYEERRDAALGKYRAVTAKYPATGAGTIARLGEGSLLLDKHDFEGAAAAFAAAQNSPLAKADREVMGRAVEGLGFVYEAKAAATPAEKDKQLDLAIAQFRSLENTDTLGFKELGMYHQARCLEAKGDRAKAVDLLKSLHERLSAPGENHPMPYLQELGDDRLRRLDPTALPAKNPGMMGGGIGGGRSSISEQQLKQLLAPKPGQK